MKKPLKISSIIAPIILLVAILCLFLIFPKTPEPIHVDPIPQETKNIQAEHDFGHGSKGHFCVEKTKVQDCDTSVKCCDFTMD